MLRNKAAKMLAAGTLLLGGVGLVAGGVLPVPLDAVTTSHEGNSPEDHGPPDDVPRDDEVEAQNGDGPDENADDTAHRVHAAREAAKALGEGAPRCAVGVYVSSAARGDFDPADPPSDFPCEKGNGAEGADIEGEDDENGGPPDHAGTRGDVDGDGKPGRGGPPDTENSNG